MKHNRDHRHLVAAFRTAALLLLIAALLGACGGSGTSDGGSADGATASEIVLQDLQGDVGVSDSSGPMETFAGMNLYDGYDVWTEPASYSWILLDAAKLVKMNEYSHVLLAQDGRKLRVTLDYGDLFFCVAEPLGDDEELTIESSNMSLSIRGTTGFLRRYDDYTVVAMLEGEAVVEVAGDGDAGTDAPAQHPVTAGWLYVVGDDGSFGDLQLRNGDIPEFVREELRNNEMVRNKIGAEEADRLAGVKAVTEATVAYQNIIEGYREALAQGPDGDSPYLQYEFVRNAAGQTDNTNWQGTMNYAVYDVNGDGTDELIVASYYEETWYLAFEMYTYADGEAIPLFREPEPDLERFYVAPDGILWTARGNGGIDPVNVYTLPAGGTALTYERTVPGLEWEYPGYAPLEYKDISIDII